MTAVPRSIQDYWAGAFAGGEARHDVMVLDRCDGVRHVALSPALAGQAGTAGTPREDAVERLQAAGLRLHDPDCLFYLPADASTEPPATGVLVPRPLTAADRGAFEAFQAQASEQDKEDSWVELDHWLAFGSFDGDRLVSAASLHRWPDSPIADLGVLTLPGARGRGHARAVVSAICRSCRCRGREPQYRCQVDNVASVALAKACGLILFGTWVVSADAPA